VKIKKSVKYDVQNLYNINHTHKDACFVQHEAERGRSDLNTNRYRFCRKCGKLDSALILAICAAQTAIVL
jgi:hypothetical protein